MKNEHQCSVLLWWEPECVCQNSWKNFWVLPWNDLKLGKNFFIHQFYLSSSSTYLWKQATSKSSTLKDTMTFCVKTLQNESKSLRKTLKLYVVIQKSLINFTWREPWTGFEKISLLVNVPQNNLRVLFLFHFHSINSFYPTKSGLFLVESLINIQIHLNKTSNL